MKIDVPTNLSATRRAKGTATITVVMATIWFASAAVLLPATGGASPGRLRTVAAFNRAAGETPENLAIEPDGTIYVSLAFASQIRRISPDGDESSVTVPTGGGITVGLVADPFHGGDLEVAVKSSDPAYAGIWRIPIAAFDDPPVGMARLAALPASSFPNGMMLDSVGNLYVADSNLGLIWRVMPGSNVASIWSQSTLLNPTGAVYQGFMLPGANGIKIHDRLVYVSNTSTDAILTVPIRADSTAGAVTPRYHLSAPDDFAIAEDGTLYVAQNVPDLLTRIQPSGLSSGVSSTLATAADGLDNPSAALFGPRPGQQSRLYITNSAYFGSQPSLEVLAVGGREELPATRANGTLSRRSESGC